MSDTEDYVLHPFVPWALMQFREGNDPNREEGYVNDLVQNVLAHLDELDEVERGQVIIDLLTLCDAQGQAITLMNPRDIEKGMQQ